MPLFGNAPKCASTVLECSCCSIHRFVAAPSSQYFLICNDAEKGKETLFWILRFRRIKGTVSQVFQGVTKRCRLSWLTKRAPQMRAGGSCGVSANEYSCTQGPQYVTFGDLTPYLTYDFTSGFIMNNFRNFRSLLVPCRCQQPQHPPWGKLSIHREKKRLRALKERHSL